MRTRKDSDESDFNASTLSFREWFAYLTCSTARNNEEKTFASTIQHFHTYICTVYLLESFSN